MIKALLDSGFLYALVDPDDEDHAAVLAVIQSFRALLVLPIPVLVEVSYLAASRLGHAKMRQFLQTLGGWNVQFESLDKADLQRVIEILNQYAGAELDFVDAAVIAIAERVDASHVLTVDRRDFLMVRPRHRAYFELLP